MSSSELADDDGSIFLFGIGLGIVVLLVLTTAINIASLWVTRSKLDSIADAAALAATHSINTEKIYLTGLSEQIDLDESLARQKALQYLSKVDSLTQLEDFKVNSISVNQNSVNVTIQANADLPFGYLNPLVPTVVISSGQAALTRD